MLKLEVPFTLICSGASKSGKTVFVRDLLRADKEYGIFERPIDKVLLVFSTHQDVYEDIAELCGDKFESAKSIPWDRLEALTGDKMTLLICDDKMTDKAETAKLAQIFTGGRHKGISCIQLVQNLYHQSVHGTDISRNASYLCLFRTPRDQAIVRTLGSQMFPNHKNFLVEAFEDATKEPYSYLWLDMTPSLKDKRFKVRSDILNPNRQTVYLPK